MANPSIATKEDARYFTPRQLNRIPVSEHDWRRLKDFSSPQPKPKRWASFVRSLALGVTVSALFNLIQLNVLKPAAGYPQSVWVVAWCLLVGSAVAAAFAQVLVGMQDQLDANPLSAVCAELTRIEATFDPPDDEPARVPETMEVIEPATTPDGSEVAAAPSTRTQTAAAPPSEGRPGRYPTGFEVGNWVRHKAFGVGVVRKKSGDALVIEFTNGETKKLLEGYAPIVRIKDPAQTRSAVSNKRIEPTQ